MKTGIFVLAMLFFTGITAQSIEPKFAQKGPVVEATYFHSNGTIAQHGYFLNNKRHGDWKMFDNQGNKLAMGTYKEGERSGKWFIWSGETLNELDYQNNTIAHHIAWNNKDTAVVSY